MARRPDEREVIVCEGQIRAVGGGVYKPVFPASLHVGDFTPESGLLFRSVNGITPIAPAALAG